MLSFFQWLYEQHQQDLSGHTVVGSFGKMRFPTKIGHGTLAKTIKDVGQSLSDKGKKVKTIIGLSGTSDVLTQQQKHKKAEQDIGIRHGISIESHPDKTLVSWLQHIESRGAKGVHVVVGSDRKKDAERIAALNQKQDKKGNTIFNFPEGIHVHIASGGQDVARVDVLKDPNHPLAKIHPSKMTEQQLKQTASASRLIDLAKKGDVKGFEAYGEDRKWIPVIQRAFK